MIMVQWNFDAHSYFGKGTAKAGNVELAGKVAYQNHEAQKLQHQSVVPGTLSWEAQQDYQMQAEQCQAFDNQVFDIVMADLEQKAETYVGESAVVDCHKSIGNNQVEYSAPSWQKQDLLEADQVQESSEQTHKADTVQHQRQALLKVEIPEQEKAPFEGKLKQVFQTYKDTACSDIQIQEPQ